MLDINPSFTFNITTLSILYSIQDITSVILLYKWSVICW